MKIPIRTRYFLWLALSIFILLAIQNGALLLEEIFDIRGRLQSKIEGAMWEAGVSLLLDTLTVAAALWFSWVIARRMLKPFRELAQAAHDVRAGRLPRLPDSFDEAGEVGQIAESVKRAFETYNEAMTRMKRFNQDASHQLRMPLTNIRALGEAALTRDRTNAEYRNTIESVLEECAKLSHLVEQLMQLAGPDKDAIRSQFETVDVGALVEETVALFRPYTEEKGVRLIAHSDATVLCSGSNSLLQQAVMNLLDNAVRVTPQSGVVEVAACRNGSQIQIMVADSGPGIPAAWKRGVFDPFRKLPGDTGMEHTGLGLAIVADIVRVHDGDIHVQDGPEGGAVFRIEIPHAEDL